MKEKYLHTKEIITLYYRILLSLTITGSKDRNEIKEKLKAIKLRVLSPVLSECEK